MCYFKNYAKIFHFLETILPVFLTCALCLMLSLLIIVPHLTQSASFLCLTCPYALVCYAYSPNWLVSIPAFCPRSSAFFFLLKQITYLSNHTLAAFTTLQSAVQARCDSPSLSSAPGSRLPRQILRAGLWSSWSPPSAICQTSSTVSSTSLTWHLWDPCFFCSRTNSLEFTARLSEGSSCRLRTI